MFRFARGQKTQRVRLLRQDPGCPEIEAGATANWHMLRFLAGLVEEGRVVFGVDCLGPTSCSCYIGPDAHSVYDDCL